MIFRPDRNAARFAAGADRMSMPEVPAELFVDAVRQVVASNQAYVPPLGKGSLYLRPLLLGTGPILGLGAQPSPKEPDTLETSQPLNPAMSAAPALWVPKPCRMYLLLPSGTSPPLR